MALETPGYCLDEFRDGLDQQLLRITQCGGGGGGSAMPTELDIKIPTLYQAPTGLPVNAPIDATKIEPGVPVTPQPAPVVAPITQTTAPNTVTTSGVVQWAKDNPLIAGGGALLLLLLLTKKKRNR